MRLAVPNVLSNLMVPLAGVVDTAILGHLETIAPLAGVALASVVFDYLYWTFGFLRMGTTGLTAQAVGRKAWGEVDVVFLRGAVIALGLGALLVLGRDLLGEWGFSLLTGSAEVKEAGRAYYDARILGAPATLLNFVFLGWFLGRERSDFALAMAAVGSLANVVLDYLLVVNAGLGSYGAGLATMISQYLTLALALLLLAKVSTPGWFSRARTLFWERGAIGRLVSLNGDIMVRTFALQTAFALFINFSAALGTTTLAANAVMLKVLSVASYFIDGFAFATESLAGIFRGEGRGNRLRELLGMNCRWSVGTGLFFAALGVLFPLQLYGVLTSHEEVLVLTTHYSPWLLGVLGLGGGAYALDGYFLGLTEGRVLRRSMLLSAGLGFLPLGLLGLGLKENHLLWGALALFMGVRAVTLALAVPPTLRAEGGP